MGPKFEDDRLEDLDFLESPIDVTNVVTRIIESLKNVKHTLRIFAGEAYWVVFDDPEFLAQLRDLAAAGVKTQIVVGPALSKGGSRRSPKILRLAEEGLIELYCRSTRGKTPHFRILDNEVVWVQPTHPPLQPLGQREEVEKITRADSPDRFNGYVRDFERYAKEEHRALNPREHYLFLRSSELRAVAALAAQGGGDYDQLTKTEIESMLKQLSEQKDTRQERLNLALANVWESPASAS